MPEDGKVTDKMKTGGLIKKRDTSDGKARQREKETGCPEGQK